MKLCRFELTYEPGIVRSGIFHDGRVYETDGERAIGVHDPGKVRFLAPIGTPPALRFFDEREGGEPTFRYGNPTTVLGPGAEIDAPPGIGDLDIRIRIAGVVASEGEHIDEEEAKEFWLGITLLVEFFAPALLESDPTRALDLPCVVGALLTTPDEIAESKEWPLRITVGEDLVFSGVAQAGLPSPALLRVASRNVPVHAAEVIGAPPLPSASLSQTSLGRGLRPRDRLQVVVESVGATSATVM